MFHIRQVIDVGRENSPLYYGQPLYSGDAGAHKWIVLLRDGMKMVDLEGASAICYFTRPTNADEKREAPEVQSVTLILNAVIEDSAALVTWTADCYAGVGPFTAIMVIARGEETAGVAIVTGMIRSRSSSAIKDPSTLIPSIDVLLAQIGAMRTATADAKSAAQEARDTMSGTQEALEEAQEALETAQEAAKAAQGWGDATASAETLDAGAGATVEVSTGASGAKVLAFGIPRGESGVYIGTEEPTDPTVQVWIDPNGEPDELPSGVTPEEIRAAVDSYLDAHPVASGATAEQAAQIQKNKEDIQELQQNGTGSGLTAEQVNALDGMFRAAAYTRADISAVYEVFRSAFGITSKTLTGISVTYSGGDVYAGALLTDLSGIVVAAIYSDGTSETVSGYTLSGEILEGQNTITVTYNGMIDTFMVTGLPHEEETDGNDPPFDAATWTSGLRITSGGKEYTGHANYDTSSYIDVSGIDAFTISRSDDVSGNVNFLCCFYDSEQAYMSATDATYINANSTTYPTRATVKVPDGAKYCRICGTKLSGVSFNELVKITV